jgi:hypothetical protein
MRSSASTIIAALRTTISNLEKGKDVSPGDPMVINLKSLLVQRIADLERNDVRAGARQSAERIS